MADIQHKNIINADLHEPKGISAAAINKVLVSDGAGSGTWKTSVTNGYEDAQNTGSAQALTSGVFLDLTNNSLGTQTSVVNILPGNSAMWDPSANELDFATAGLSLGDAVVLRADLDIITSGANRTMVVNIDLAHGDAIEFSLNLIDLDYKTTGTHKVVRTILFTMDVTQVINNPAKISCKSDGAGDSVLLNGLKMWTHPISPIYV